MGEIGAAFRRIDGDGSADLTWDEFEAAARSFAISQVRSGSGVSEGVTRGNWPGPSWRVEGKRTDSMANVARRTDGRAADC